MDSEVKSILCASCKTYSRLNNRSYCRVCHNRQNVEYKKANQHMVRGQHLKKFWPNMSTSEAVAEYTRLLAAQGSKCKICRKPETSKRVKQLAVDHCHKTGRVRGLLCDKCNRAIGLFQDSASSMWNAIRYLEGGF